jgi:hypothetical protein
MRIHDWEGKTQIIFRVLENVTTSVFIQTDKTTFIHRRSLELLKFVVSLHRWTVNNYGENCECLVEKDDAVSIYRGYIIGHQKQKSARVVGEKDG